MNENQLKYLLLSCVLLGIVMKRCFNKYYVYLCRKINLDSISDNYYLSSNEINKYRERIDKNLKIEHYDNMVMRNANMFLQDYTKDELIILKKNIQSLKISNDRFSDKYLVGSYNLETNTIIANDESFNHEMHHVASTLGLINGVMISGFMQDKFIDIKSLGIGMGINEGYTEYLSSKQMHSDNIYYKKIVDLIPLVEMFFDNELDLRKCYFNADLESLIKRFSLVCSKDDSINLIKDIDKLMFYESYRSWFDKTNVLEFSIRLRLLEYYERLSGSKKYRELFIPEYMVDNLDKAKKLVL